MSIYTWKANPVTAFFARAYGALSARSIESFTFVGSSGRSGTHSIAEMFSAVPGCLSLHEPHPAMFGQILSDANTGNEDVVAEHFRIRKLPCIYMKLAGHRWYLESNHLFIKVFADLAVEHFGDRVRLIHVKRNADSVAASFFHRGSIPGTVQGNRYLLDPAWPANVLSMSCELDRPPFDHPYFKCVWYWYEIEARMARFHDRYPTVPVWTMETDQLSNTESVKRLAQWLNVPFEPVLPQVGTRADATALAPQIPNEITPERLAGFHRICIDKASELGWKLASDRTNYEL